MELHALLSWTKVCININGTTLCISLFDVIHDIKYSRGGDRNVLCNHNSVMRRDDSPYLEIY